jgi:DegV family protein with EDD domain
MSKFSIVIDTSCDISTEYLEKHGIKSIPIPFHLDGVEYEDGRWEKVSDTQFYDALAKGSIAGTTLANLETFKELFTDYAERGEELLIILLSSGLSGTYENAVAALEEVKETYPDCKIFVLDSRNAAGGVGMVLIQAVNKRAEGATLEETGKWLEKRRHSCLSLFTVDDLMYLHRGGRLSKLQAVAGSIIGIKPLLNVHPDGTLKLKDKARGRRTALEKLAGQMKRSLNEDTVVKTVVISHSNCLEDAETLLEIVKENTEVEEVFIEMMGPVIGAHVGPGCIALFFVADMNREEYEAKFYS